MPKVIMELRNVSKIYNLGSVRVKALDGINLQVEEGDVMVILGPSGSGKSTLLNMFSAMDRPTRGSIYLEGTNLASMSDGQMSKVRRDKIGFIFQSFNLLHTMSAIENVLVPVSAWGAKKKLARKRAKALLTLVGLGGRMDHRPVQMSGGEQQRVAIARALINNPLIILADEPTGNVDSKTSEEVITMLRRLNQQHGQTIVMVTHDIGLADIATVIVRLKDGRIVDIERRSRVSISGAVAARA